MGPYFKEGDFCAPRRGGIMATNLNDPEKNGGLDAALSLTLSPLILL